MMAPGGWPSEEQLARRPATISRSASLREAAAGLAADQGGFGFCGGWWTAD